METKPLIPNVYAADCPTRHVLDLIGDRWTTLIIGMLAHGTLRFSELQRSVAGISQKMLSQTLRNMERDGLVKRTVYPEVPPRVEYHLTELGETLCGPISAIHNWAMEHIGDIQAAQQVYDGKSKR